MRRWALGYRGWREGVKGRVHIAAWGRRVLLVADRNLAMPPLRGGARNHKVDLKSAKRLTDAERRAKVRRTALTLSCAAGARAPRSERHDGCHQ